MSPAGELSFTASRTSPYSRYSLTLQPFDWLEGTFRYTAVTNRDYGSPALSGDQSLKDKAFDLKLRLLEETRWRPELAIGGRDIGGTGLFSGEYIVANKRFGALDFSLGLGWGYLGARDDLENPFSLIDDKFDTRDGGGGMGGEFNADTWFRGPTAVFGGVQWQTPWDRLLFKLEVEGNDYRHEPLDNDQDQDWPVNIGAVYRATDWLDLHLAWERGDTPMFGITLHTNFVSRRTPPKRNDPPLFPLREGPRPSQPADWAQVARDLERNAGYQVSRITQREREIVVHGEQVRYFHDAEALGRGARILDRSAGEDIDWLTVVDSRYGMPIQETSLNRDTYRAAVRRDAGVDDLRRTLSQTTPLPRREKELLRQKPRAFSYGLGLGYRQSVGGPDDFILYQFNANLGAEYRFTPGTWASGLLSGNLYNNFDKFKYDGPSNLPRVRTNIREYWTTSDVTMPYFQLNHARRLDQDLFGMVYGGYLESMFAGAGGELLYRPMNERWALGVDINWVKKRDFEQDFGVQDYNVVTGHVTGYLRNFPIPDVLAKVSVGRYLARDIGVTFDLSREFANGVRFGAWATFTDVSEEEFGEGSFDKGIYVSIPFDELLTTSVMRRADFSFAPLTRDGGARLARNWTLYDLTEGRNADLFHSNLEKIVD